MLFCGSGAGVRGRTFPPLSCLLRAPPRRHSSGLRLRLGRLVGRTIRGGDFNDHVRIRRQRFRGSLAVGAVRARHRRALLQHGAVSGFVLFSALLQLKIKS
jgi:hypothetical protein